MSPYCAPGSVPSVPIRFLTSFSPHHLEVQWTFADVGTLIPCRSLPPLEDLGGGGRDSLL